MFIKDSTQKSQQKVYIMSSAHCQSVYVCFSDQMSICEHKAYKICWQITAKFPKDCKNSCTLSLHLWISELYYVTELEHLPQPLDPHLPLFFFFFVWLILLSSAALFLHCSYEWRRPSVQHRGWASKLMNFRELFSTSKTHGQQFLFKGVRVTCSWKRAKPFYTRLCPWFNVKSWEFWSQLHCKVVSIQWWSTEISSLLWWDEHRRCYERILSTSKCKNKTSSRVKCMIHFLPWGWRKVFFRYIGKYIDL